MAKAKFQVGDRVRRSTKWWPEEKTHFYGKVVDIVEGFDNNDKPKIGYMIKWDGDSDISKFLGAELVASNKKALSNPSSNFESASEVASGFHGRPNTYIEDIIETEKYHSKLAHLGDLVEFEILDKSGRKVIPINFAEHDSEDHVSLAATPERNQLMLSGGNQAIDLSSFSDLSDNELAKDYVQIGSIFSISYFSDKHHLEGPKYQAQGTEYIHKFGEEENGELPVLVYDKLNCRMLIVGGSYEVRDEGIYN